MVGNNVVADVFNWGSHLLHDDGNTVVLINKTEEIGLYIQKSKVIIKSKL